MIEKYEIKKINGEERLFLYFNYNYEFGIFEKVKKNNLRKKIQDYIKNNNINYKGTIISIVVGGALIGNLVLNNPVIENNHEYYKSSIIDIDKLLYIPNIEIDNNKVEESEINIINNDINIQQTEKTKNNKDVIVKNESQYNYNNKDNNEKNENQNNQNDNKTNNKNIETNQDIENKTTEVIDESIYIKIKRKNKNVETMELEEYVIGVVAAEMPALFHEEALRSQAIIARTYALKANSLGKILTDNESTQSYKNNQELKNLWGTNFDKYYIKIRDSVLSTKGMFITYNGNYIEAVYHSTSNGKTENSKNVWGIYYPYLVSVDSKYDSLNPSFVYETLYTYDDLSNKLKMEITKDTQFNIIDINESNRVSSIEINNIIFKGTEFRNLLGLRSTDFTIESQENTVKFTTKGYGHGVGLSQYGANGMAKNGYNYLEILKHYYPGTIISK